MQSRIKFKQLTLITLRFCTLLIKAELINSHLNNINYYYITLYILNCSNLYSFNLVINNSVNLITILFFNSITCCEYVYNSINYNDFLNVSVLIILVHISHVILGINYFITKLTVILFIGRSNTISNNINNTVVNIKYFMSPINIKKSSSLLLPFNTSTTITNITTQLLLSLSLLFKLLIPTKGGIKIGFNSLIFVVSLLASRVLILLMFNYKALITYAGTLSNNVNVQSSGSFNINGLVFNNVIYNVSYSYNYYILMITLYYHLIDIIWIGIFVIVYSY